MTMNSVNVHIPNADMPFFRKLSKKMGWTYSSTEDEKVQAMQSIEQSFRELKKAREEGTQLPDVEQLFQELQTA